MEWKDCFGKPLKEGSDVVYAKWLPYGGVEMHSGVIHKLSEESIEFSFNRWDGDEEEVLSAELRHNDFKDGIVRCMYKIS
jgi:hypothetical protein